MRRNQKNLGRALTALAFVGLVAGISKPAGAACTGNTTCFGVGALESSQGENSAGDSAFGYQALQQNPPNSGGANTAIGLQALTANTTGQTNTAVGVQ
jgi:hypothetical protein